MRKRALFRVALIWLAAGLAATTSGAVAQTGIIVHPKYGGYILGFGIDPAGGEGLLSEYNALKNGKNFIATETFNQKTGKILTVLSKRNNTRNNWLTWGTFGPHIGLDAYYQPKKISYSVLNPLEGNAFTGSWTPTISTGYRLADIEGTLTNSDVAGLLLGNGSQPTSVFSSNITANTFGAQVEITDTEFLDSNSPVMAFDDKTNEAVLASTDGVTPKLALANLVSGNVTEFTGVGYGYVNGIGVDAAKGIAVTTTGGEGLEPAGLEFYDLQKQTGVQYFLPCSDNGSQFDFGLTVTFEPVHSLFFVEQYASDCASGTVIDVYDTKGDLLQTISGFSTLPVSPTPIALNTKNRTGFIYQDRTATTLQSFAY